jgi:low temperature requirement protein LtrA
MGQAGKQVSWVELYLDLVFVLAIGELAHLIGDEPKIRTVWITLGLFVPLWWTWVGFAVLYNRHGADAPGQRVLFLTCSIPAGVAAVAVEPASTGHSAAFALSLAVTRVVLGVAHARDDDSTSSAGDLLRQRTARAYAISAALFVVSIWLPRPLRYLLWAAAIGHESRVVLTEDRQAARTARSTHDFTALTPSDPAEALDAHHFAERFGLFVIILLGEVVVQAGQSAASGQPGSASGWGALVAAMALAGALWWAYFDSAAELNLKVLELSGGSPTMARAIFAVGHMVPAFALLMTASGVGLLLHQDPPRIAYWLPCIGAGMYLAGTQAFVRARGRWTRVARSALLAATFALGVLHRVLGPHAYLWLTAVWVTGSVGLAGRTPARVPGAQKTSAPGPVGLRR